VAFQKAPGEDLLVIAGLSRVGAALRGHRSGARGCIAMQLRVREPRPSGRSSDICR